MTVHDAICRLKRMGRSCLIRSAFCVAMLGASAPGSAREEAVAGDVHVEKSQGFARILLQLSQAVESEVNVAGGVVVVHFRRPVDIPIDKLTHLVPDYVGAARSDPDGRGFRIALNRRVTVNSMAAGERLYIDLLPDTWKGLAPGLPTKVIEELSRRAREAERAMRARQVVKREEKAARVRIATQPTFTRYVFELPDVIPVTSERGADDVTLTFAAPVKFDFGDMKSTLPKAVKSIEAFERADSVKLRFALNGKTDIRTFREDQNYVLDVGSSDAKEPVVPARPDDAARLMQELAPKSGPLADVEPPHTVPAGDAGPAREAQPAPAPAAATPAQPREAPPVAAAAAAVAPPSAPREPSTRQAMAEPQAPRAAQREPASPRGPENKPAAAMPPALGVAPRDNSRAVSAEIRRQPDGVTMTFPFGAQTPAAIFRRAGTLWMVFDTRAAIALPDFGAESGGMIRHVLGTALRDGYVVRLMLDRPRLVGAVADGDTWRVTIGDSITNPSTPLVIDRNMANASRPSISIPLDHAREVHRIADPDMGDTLLVVTAPGPARGFIRPQEFVEFRALASTHGVAVQPLADDVQVELSPDGVVVARPSGLTLSGPGAAMRSVSAHRSMIFDPQLWGFDRQADITERQYKLIAAAADVGETKRSAPRLELARFYLSRDMFPEAKAVLDVTLSEERPSSDDPSPLVLRAITMLMLNRPEEALKELNHQTLGDQLDTPLWRAFALARLGKWDEARRGFKNAEGAIATLPVELQRIALKEAIRASIEVRDYETAQNLFSELQTIGTPPDMQPALSVLQGRLAQGLGKNSEALRNFRQAADSEDRPFAAQGMLRGLSLRHDMGDLKRADLINELETLTAVWRGDETEIEALHKLARLYTEEQRYRDAFHVMRSALKAHPDAQLSRRIYDEAAITFDSLFLAGKSDALPAIEALSLFYDFRELTPIGRRGDEMIRRLADRLVSVDLLPQAAELLQHQIEHRLQGAARAHVATRLAVIYLMDSKPGRAQSILRATRASELNTDLRNLRMLLEARALSDSGRHEVALEAIERDDSREATRLRADILWAAKRFNKSAEQIERMHGERWRDFAPLSDAERADLLRAAIGYSLADDKLGIARLKERYQAKMIEGPDKRAFEIATSPDATNSAEFAGLAKTITAFTSLEAFLRDMRSRFPEIGTLSRDEAPVRSQTPSQTQSDPGSTGSVNGRRKRT
jgi:tetratricopeptide (TPR) repeat protein